MSQTTDAYYSPPADPLLKRLPKCNLHTHLEGSLRPETLWDLAQAQGINLGIRREQLPEAMQINGQERSLVDYLRKISIVYPMLKNRQALKRAAFEAAEDAALDGVIYLELRFGPALHTSPDLPIEVVIESVLLGLQQAERQYGIKCRLIAAALRNHNPQTNVLLAQTALLYKDDGLVGYDLAGDEAGFAASLHLEAYRIAAEGGLGITVHAGEAAGPENVRYAVEVLNAKRIGHGVRSIESPQVIDLLRDRRVLLEICLTSNVHTRVVQDIQSHPVRRLFMHDIPISINDDDPTTSRTRVSNELTLLRHQFGFTLHELASIQQTSLAMAFLQDSELKSNLEQQLLRGWEEV